MVDLVCWCADQNNPKPELPRIFSIHWAKRLSTRYCPVIALYSFPATILLTAAVGFSTMMQAGNITTFLPVRFQLGFLMPDSAVSAP